MDQDVVGASCKDVKMFHTPKPSLSLGRRCHRLIFHTLNAMQNTSSGLPCTRVR